MTCFLQGRVAGWRVRGFPAPAPPVIIPIIMARYENVINNTEDIVVAISHMA